MRIVFMGTDDFSKESLECLVKNNFNIVGVVTAPDRQKGRGMKTIPSIVKQYAEENNLKIFQPEKIVNNSEFKEQIMELEPDLVCVVSYGKILPKSFLEIPKLGCINVHPSLLPKYRGSAPIQWAVLNGDKTTGVTIMYMNEKMDAGDIILQEEVEIENNETTGELWERLAKKGAIMLSKVVKQVEGGTVKRTVQPEEFTLAPMIEKSMAKIDWEKDVNEINNLIRGLNPILGAYSFLDDKKIKFWRANVFSIEDFCKKFEEYTEFEYRIKDMQPGYIIISDSKKGLFIKAKNGVLSITEIQGENAKRMQIGDFLRGNQIDVGLKFQ